MAPSAASNPVASTNPPPPLPPSPPGPAPPPPRRPWNINIDGLASPCPPPPPPVPELLAHVSKFCCQLTPSLRYQSCPSMAYTDCGLTCRSLSSLLLFAARDLGVSPPPLPPPIGTGENPPPCCCCWCEYPPPPIGWDVTPAGSDQALLRASLMDMGGPLTRCPICCC